MNNKREPLIYVLNKIEKYIKHSYKNQKSAYLLNFFINRAHANSLTDLKSSNAFKVVASFFIGVAHAADFKCQPHQNLANYIETNQLKNFKVTCHKEKIPSNAHGKCGEKGTNSYATVQMGNKSYLFRSSNKMIVSCAGGALDINTEVYKSIDGKFVCSSDNTLKRPVLQTLIDKCCYLEKKENIKCYETVNDLLSDEYKVKRKTKKAPPKPKMNNNNCNKAKNHLVELNLLNGLPSSEANLCIPNTPLSAEPCCNKENGCKPLAGKYPSFCSRNGFASYCKNSCNNSKCKNYEKYCEQFLNYNASLEHYTNLFCWENLVCENSELSTGLHGFNKEKNNSSSKNNKQDKEAK